MIEGALQKGALPPLSLSTFIAILCPSPPPHPLCDSLSGQKGIVLSDACPATSDPVACAQVFYGVMQKGLFSAIQSFSNLVRGLLLSLAATSSLPVASLPLGGLEGGEAVWGSCDAPGFSLLRAKEMSFVGCNRAGD